MNVQNETVEALMELIKQCFYYNRKYDRLVSILGVKFACNNSADLIHHGMAHYFPALSDKIGELCLERYNIPVAYGATPEGKEDYNSVTEMMAYIEESSIDFQNMMIRVCDIAFKKKDLQVFSDMQELLKDYNRLVEQAILLKDKIDIYGEDRISSFDAHIKDHFWIL